MHFYQFNSDDFAKIIEDTRFQKACRYALEESFISCLERAQFRGDPELLKTLKTLKTIADEDQQWELIKDLSLPYLSPCEDPNIEYDNPKTTESVKRDYELREYLLSKAKSKLDLEWWCYIHECETEAIFILSVMCRILFPSPEMKFYLFSGLHHTVIINQAMYELLQNSPTIIPFTDEKLANKSYSRDINEPLIFDIISQSIDEDFKWIFNGYDMRSKIIEFDNIIDFYGKSYYYVGIEKHLPKYRALFESLKI